MKNKIDNLIEETQKNGCKCQECGCYYKIDFNVPKEIWVQMCGKYNLLCGCCIVKRLEQLEEWDYWDIIKSDQLINSVKEEMLNNIIRTCKSSKENAGILSDTLKLNKDYIKGWETAFKKMIKHIKATRDSKPQADLDSLPKAERENPCKNCEQLTSDNACRVGALYGMKRCVQPQKKRGGCDVC